EKTMTAGEGVADFGPVVGPAGFGTHGEIKIFVFVDPDGAVSGETDFRDRFADEWEEFAVDFEDAAVGETAAAEAESAVDCSDGIDVLRETGERSAAFAAREGTAEADADARLLQVDAEKTDGLGRIE